MLGRREYANYSAFSISSPPVSTPTAAGAQGGTGCMRCTSPADRGLFSDSSASEKRRFEKRLRFRHPDGSGEAVSCTWHGKVRHLTPQDPLLLAGSSGQASVRHVHRPEAHSAVTVWRSARRVMPSSHAARFRAAPVRDGQGERLRGAAMGAPERSRQSGPRKPCPPTPPPRLTALPPPDPRPRPSTRAAAADPARPAHPASPPQRAHPPHPPSPRHPTAAVARQARPRDLIFHGP